VSTGPGGLDLQHRTLSHYQEFFRQAGLPLEVKRVNLSRGLKYYFGQMVNGLTHARYAFIGTKKSGDQPGWNLPERSAAKRLGSRVVSLHDK
jgi:hypothetical protein